MLYRSIFIIIGVFIFFIFSAEFDILKADCKDETALHLAQCLRAECDTCERFPNEKAAIAHILVKLTNQYNNNKYNKRTRSLDDTIKAYCSIFGSKRKRAVRIRHSPFGKSIHGNKQWWESTIQWTTKFVADPSSIIDPTPLAMYWGGDMDKPPKIKGKKWVKVTKMCNTFWKVVLVRN